MVDTNNLSVPAIHMNGSGWAVLLHDYLTSHNAIHAALRAVAGTSSHERYHGATSSEAMLKAAREHRSRMQRLNDIKAELAAIAIASGC